MLQYLVLLLLPLLRLLIENEIGSGHDEVREEGNDHSHPSLFGDLNEVEGMGNDGDVMRRERGNDGSELGREGVNGNDVNLENRVNRKETSHLSCDSERDGTVRSLPRSL